MKEGQEVGGALQRRPSSQAEQVVVQHALRPCRQPGHVETEAGMVAEQLVQPIALEDAEHQGRQRLDRMLHLPDHRSLQANQVTGQEIVENLPPPVIKHLEAEGPAREQCKEMGAVSALRENDRAGLGRHLAGLEARNEFQLAGGKVTKGRQGAQRALLAGHAAPG